MREDQKQMEHVKQYTYESDTVEIIAKSNYILVELSKSFLTASAQFVGSVSLTHTPTLSKNSLPLPLLLLLRLLQLVCCSFNAFFLRPMFLNLCNCICVCQTVAKKPYSLTHSANGTKHTGIVDS